LSRWFLRAPGLFRSRLGNQNYGDAEILADALIRALKDRNDYLVVASTDMSHYHPYDEANSIDKRLIAALSMMKGKALYDEANIGLCELCGVMPVTSALLAAGKAGIWTKRRILKYANSGDTAGDKSKVVGYLSAAIYKGVTSHKSQVTSKEKGQAMLNDSQRKRLLQIARGIYHELCKRRQEEKFY